VSALHCSAAVAKALRLMQAGPSPTSACRRSCRSALARQRLTSHVTAAIVRAAASLRR
jgi:hypothetical protein